MHHVYDETPDTPAHLMKGVIPIEIRTSIEIKETSSN
jgi:hypothetical protein